MTRRRAIADRATTARSLSPADRPIEAVTRHVARASDHMGSGGRSELVPVSVPRLRFLEKT